MYPQLVIAVLLDSDALAQSLMSFLNSDRYRVNRFKSEQELFECVELQQQPIDCLILQQEPYLTSLINSFRERTILLPMVVILAEPATDPQRLRAAEGKLVEMPFESAIAAESTTTTSVLSYHAATVVITEDQVPQVAQWINQAIVQFLKLPPTSKFSDREPALDLMAELTTQNSLMLEQRRLTEKLKERLGYLGVYYKRDPKNFLRHLPPNERQKFLKKLKAGYREIALVYFSGDQQLNQKIDDFVNTAFFADVSVSQIVEIHMDLIDEFSKQLKLEGRSDDILLDYRLTLIDTIAHLCEMYRRSIPRES